MDVRPPPKRTEFIIRLIICSKLTSYRKPAFGSNATTSLEPPSDFFHQYTSSHDPESSERTRRYLLSSQMRQVWKNGLEGEALPFDVL